MNRLYCLLFGHQYLLQFVQKGSDEVMGFLCSTCGRCRLGFEHVRE